MSLIDDEALLKMAEAEILKDAKKAVIRHSTTGMYGHQPYLKPNKVFLTNTILQTVTSNKLRSLKGNKPLVKHKSTKRKLVKKDEKKITFQIPKKNKNKIDANKNKNESQPKLGLSHSEKLIELNNKISRKRLKIKRLKV